jgi:hypothetical protein
MCCARIGFGVWPHDAPVRVHARPTAADEAARPWCRSACDRVRDEPRATTRLEDHSSSVAGWFCRSTLLPGLSGVDVERDRSWLVAGRPGPDSPGPRPHGGDDSPGADRPDIERTNGERRRAHHARVRMRTVSSRRIPGRFFHCSRPGGGLGCACSGGSYLAAALRDGWAASVAWLIRRTGGATWGQGCQPNACDVVFPGHHRCDLDILCAQCILFLDHRHSRAC